jgi:hypothetical protein
MNEVYTMLVNLLYELCSKGILTTEILDSIEKTFGVDVYTMCDNNGITYNEK